MLGGEKKGGLDPSLAVGADLFHCGVPGASRSGVTGFDLDYFLRQQEKNIFAK
jgi:hypothetical protein